MNNDSPIIVNMLEGFAEIILNRPKAFNSFHREMALLFQKEFDKLNQDPSIRAIIITGEGKAFCAGQDLKEVTTPELNPGFEKILAEHYNPIIKKITGSKKPVIAAVNGVAAGAGANIALACDFVIAKEGSSFIQAFVNIGLVPDSGGTYFLPRLVGLAKAKELMILGSKLSAEEAQNLGLIYLCEKEETFRTSVESLAKKLSQMPSYAIGLIKESLHASYQNNMNQQLELEKKLQLRAAGSEDYKEGVQAFIEKRKPSFKGK